MADRYDPKVTVRPTADRKAADAHSAHNDDPLFELARIVQGRGPVGNAAAPPSRARSVPPAADPVKPPPDDHDVLRDLEAELLNDLQSSFAAVKEAIAPVSAPAPAPKAVQPAPAVTAPSVKAPVPPAPQPAPARGEALRDQPAAAAAVAATPRVFAAARPPIQPAPEQLAKDLSVSQPVRERGPDTQPVMAAPAETKAPAAPGQKKSDVGGFSLRPSTAPQVRPTAAPPAPPMPMSSDKPGLGAAKPSRWDKPAEPPKPQAPSRFAPPRAVTQAQSSQVQPATPAVDDEDLPFGEGPPFAHEGGDVGDEFPLDEFDLVPGYGEDVELPPYPEDETEALRKRSVPRSLVMVAGILAVVLVGVLAFVMLRHGSSTGGAPPIIAADAGPTKIAPPQPPAGSNNDQNKLIYDRVDSGSANGSADTKLVTQGNQPIAPVPSSNDANNPIARVIAPGGPEPDAPAAAPGAPASADTTSADAAAPPTADNDSADSLGPRKVRTVIVKPDGTIVSSDAVPAPGDAPASTDTAPAASNVPAAPPIPTNDDTAAIAGGKSGQELPITPDPNAPPSAAAAAPAPAPAKTAAAPAPTPAPQPKAAPKVASADNGNGPIDLTQSASQASTDGASAGQSGGAMPVVAGGTLVQVSSQRSEDAANATFRDLQARYPNILGGYNPDIKKIDLGDRGTYYRVRVGPFSSGNAQSMCSALKNAGGNCILAH